MMQSLKFYKSEDAEPLILVVTLGADYLCGRMC